MPVPVQTGSDELLGEIHDQVLVLTLNRPDRLNALSEGIYRGLATGLARAADDGDIRVVMLTGAGRAFCAGGDVKGMNERNTMAEATAAQSDGLTEKVAGLQERQNATVLAMRQLPKPVVAALGGAAAGAGMSIALAADLRVAAPSAFLLAAFAGVAASGDFGGSWSLTQIVGTAKAREMYLRNERVYAEEALRIGLVNAVFDAETFTDSALGYCQELAAQAPIAMAKMKENLNRALGADFAAALDAEAENMVATMATADHKEAAAAFVEKRTAFFRGH